MIKETISKYEKIGQSFSYVCCLYPTSPLTKYDDLNSGLEKLIDENLDSVFPVVPFSYPVWRGLGRKNDRTKMIWPEYLNTRSQDLEEIYHDAGQWYWLKSDAIENSLWTDRSDSILLDQTNVQDIDNESDWKMAEIKYKLIHGRDD